MLQKSRYYIALSLCSFLLSLGLGYRTAALSQVMPLPPEVATCLPAAPPNIGMNQFETLGSYSESGVNYLYLLVTPPRPVSPPPEAEPTEGAEPGPENSAADETNPLPSNPWRLVISYSKSGCQALMTPEKQSLSVVPQAVGRQMELQRYQKVIVATGGIQAFKQALFSFTNDPHHGYDVPETVQIAPESAWALQQLGIKLPSNWVITP